MTDQLAYRLAFVVVIAAAIGFGARLTRRYGRPGNSVSRSADGAPIALALAVGGLAFYGGLLAFLVWPRLIAWSAIGLPPAVRWLGLPLLAGGVALAMWARFTLGRSSTTTAVPAPGAELVTAGPYRWLRHPIYSAGLAIFPGCALLADSWLIFGSGLFVLVVLDIRTRREERLLLERFGDAYRDHMARTRRWLPRWRIGPAPR